MANEIKVTVGTVTQGPSGSGTATVEVTVESVSTWKGSVFLDCTATGNPTPTVTPSQEVVQLNPGESKTRNIGLSVGTGNTTSGTFTADGAGDGVSHSDSAAYSIT